MFLTKKKKKVIFRVLENEKCFGNASDGRMLTQLLRVSKLDRNTKKNAFFKKSSLRVKKRREKGKENQISLIKM